MLTEENVASEEKDFRVEFRVDVKAKTPEEAIKIARASVVEFGEVTAVFDEDWEEC